MGSAVRNIEFIGAIALALATLGQSVEARGEPAALAADLDRRALATESRLTDAERFQLLHGIMAMPFGPPGWTLPPTLKITAGYVKGIPRLGIPDLLETDASLGVVNPLGLRAGDFATALPSGLALASTFDTDLAFQGGVTIGSEARAKGFNVLLGGGVNLARDPRNGRNFEYLGEDPLLAGTMAGSAIRGTQSQGVVSTMKHFALNAQETLRNTADARIERAALRESDLLAFELALERGAPGAVMCAYNQVNGDYSCGNDWLLNQVLKQDWKFAGWVMSDWGAVHDASYFGKGLDQQSGSQLDEQVWFDAPLRADLAAGRITKAQLSAAVRRILRSLYAVGADHTPAESQIDYAAHAAVAQRIAEEGIVLLKNQGALPLAGAKRSILVVGGHADLGVLSGGGSSQVTPYGGASIIVPIGAPGELGALARATYMPSSPLEALKAALPEASIDFQSGYDIDSAAAAAAHADTVVVFATQWQCEGYDHASMLLPEGQDALIEALARANHDVVVVLETGNPVRTPWLDAVNAVMEAWYPGERGGPAIAAVLTGATNPSGHLAMSFPIDESQLPRPAIPGLGLADRTPVEVDYPEGSGVGYRWYSDRSLTPLFAFGQGLSFTSFEFAALRIRRSSNSVTANFRVTNTGARAGAAVPQLYLVTQSGAPRRRLVGFERVPLEPGESRELTVTVDPRLLAHWDEKRRRWQIDAGRYDFALGRSAAQLGEPVAVQFPDANIKP
jgi:beta-glucosidase